MVRCGNVASAAKRDRSRWQAAQHTWWWVWCGYSRPFSSCSLPCTRWTRRARGAFHACFSNVPRSRRSCMVRCGHVASAAKRDRSRWQAAQHTWWWVWCGYSRPATSCSLPCTRWTRRARGAFHACFSNVPRSRRSCMVRCGHVASAAKRDRSRWQAAQHTWWWVWCGYSRPATSCSLPCTRWTRRACGAFHACFPRLSYP